MGFRQVRIGQATEETLPVGMRRSIGIKEHDAASSEKGFFGDPTFFMRSVLGCRSLMDKSSWTHQIRR
jgi:hypothetical protein